MANCGQWSCLWEESNDYNSATQIKWEIAIAHLKGNGSRSMKCFQASTDLISMMENSLSKMCHKTIRNNRENDSEYWIGTICSTAHGWGWGLWSNYTNGGHCPPFHKWLVTAGTVYISAFNFGFTVCRFRFSTKHIRFQPTKWFHSLSIWKLSFLSWVVWKSR